MAGLKGLTPPAKPQGQPKTLTEAQQNFINGAPLQHKSAEERTSTRRFRRTHFSLDDDTNALVDAATLTSRTFRVSRSAAVRAAMRAFSEMPEAQKLAYLQAEADDKE